jgi:hypothetical protein
MACIKACESPQSHQDRAHPWLLGARDASAGRFWSGGKSEGPLPTTHLLPPHPAIPGPCHGVRPASGVHKPKRKEPWPTAGLQISHSSLGTGLLRAVGGGQRASSAASLPSGGAFAQYEACARQGKKVRRRCYHLCQLCRYY